jgi:hypothetical protein
MTSRLLTPFEVAILIADAVILAVTCLVWQSL